MQWTNGKMAPAHTIASDLRNATICEVYRVDDSYPNGRQLVNGEPLHGYGILSKPIPLPKRLREELLRVLTDAKTYNRHSVPLDCLFRPGVAFRFIDGSTKVDLLVCFICNELRYYMDCHIVGESYFQSEELLELTKKIFPDDKKIQSLK
ncbi:hypothetical protein OAG93_00200 [bacterium]|nr:hypothetical protein [bacterium]